MGVTRVRVAVETRAPTGETVACLVGADPAVLVDPAARVDRLDRAVTDRDVAHVAVTHHHPDHVGAVESYARQCDATVWARAGRVEAFAAATGVEPDRTFVDGTTIPTGDGPVRVVDTPGHAPEHVAYRSAGTLVCGDLAIADGSVAVAAPEGDVRAYLTSLRRVHAMAPDRLVPAHGPDLRGEAVRETVRRLIAHRLARERRVREAVAAGAGTVRAVREAAYEKDLSGVEELADATVRAHLAKLAVEGRVEWDGQRAGLARR
ncbi:MBL fold hydrolase [Halobacteriales archaeon QH_10_67_22]|nr:MAG: MBL fold hydrolase [Halobacteriales archaeon QH_10_67_22]